MTSGDKSQGAYLFSGNNSNPGNFLGIDRVFSVSTYGTTYVIPTEDEWYKAAYYKPDGSGYSAYANGTEVAPATGVQANYSNAMTTPWNVGNGMQEQNGTYDMMGNAWEWSETQWQDGFINRIIRGGSFTSNDHALSKSGPLYDFDPQEGRYEIGFRVASIPEPCTLLLLGLGGLSFGFRKRNFKHG